MHLPGLALFILGLFIFKHFYVAGIRHPGKHVDDVMCSDVICHVIRSRGQVTRSGHVGVYGQARV